jgi:hypothetical protein
MEKIADNETLRAAAKALTTAEAIEVFGIHPIPRRLVASLGEQAFSSALRGLTYPEEVKDIDRFLTSCALDPNEDSDHVLLATGGARACAYRGDTPEGLALVRAIAAYFLKGLASTLADVRADDAKHCSADTNAEADIVDLAKARQRFDKDGAR